MTINYACIRVSVGGRGTIIGLLAGNRKSSYNTTSRMNIRDEQLTRRQVGAH